MRLINTQLKNIILAWYICKRRKSKAAVDSGSSLQALQTTRRPSEGTDYTPIRGHDIALNPRTVAKSNGLT